MNGDELIPLREWKNDPPMTRRDWFAGMAMQGILSSAQMVASLLNTSGGSGEEIMLAKACLHFTDALIVALSQEPKP